jgi:hypothetical protein
MKRKMEQKVNLDKLVIGGLHKGDFERASRLCKPEGYVLVSFELDVGSYHWNAVYVRAELLENKSVGTGSPTVSLSLPTSVEVPKP